MLSLLLCLSAALQLERKNGSARSAVFHSTNSDISTKRARGSVSELARLIDLAGLRGTVEAAFALQLRGGSAELESQVELAESWMRQGDFDAAYWASTFDQVGPFIASLDADGDAAEKVSEAELVRRIALGPPDSPGKSTRSPAGKSGVTATDESDI